MEGIFLTGLGVDWEWIDSNSECEVRSAELGEDAHGARRAGRGIEGWWMDVTQRSRCAATLGWMIQSL
ncbi:MAG: hypothetical protein JWO20_2610 [Candidatus Angelobacter sp.]|nr:hypothetical protein [Candidatus Angelobacter sp.]